MQYLEVNSPVWYSLAVVFVQSTCTIYCFYLLSAFLDLKCACVCAVSPPVDGRVAVRAWGTFPSELLQGRVASSSPPCWTNNKVEGYVPRSEFTYNPQPNTKHQPLPSSICEHESADVAHVKIAISGLIGAEIPVYGVHEECWGLGVVQGWGLVWLCLRLLVLGNGGLVQ